MCYPFYIEGSLNIGILRYRVVFVYLKKTPALKNLIFVSRGLTKLSKHMHKVTQADTWSGVTRIGMMTGYKKKKSHYSLS